MILFFVGYNVSMYSRVFLVLVFFCRAIAQSGPVPLEFVTAEGSTIPQSVVQEIAGLKIDAPIDQAGIEEACRKLQDSGLFASISYRYAQGAQKGFALTLSLADQTPSSGATIDVPGVDEDEAWRWLAGRFRRFDRQVPQAETAQKFLAHELEGHLGKAMRGQPLTVRMENDFKTRKLTLSFQPEVLPKLGAVTFTGNAAISAVELGAVLNRVTANADYTDRKFAAALELNLRPFYEEHGFYRVKLVPGRAQLTANGAAVNVAVTEGASYQLGTVEVLGENLPVESMMGAAKFPKGRLANWRQIQEGIWAMEKVVKRSGYFAATATPERSFDDAAHLLGLRIRVNLGPLYHYGEFRVAGLNADQEAKARRLWKGKKGEPYDYGYPVEFMQELSRVVEFRNFQRHDAVTRKGVGDHVMDVDLVFEGR